MIRIYIRSMSPESRSYSENSSVKNSDGFHSSSCEHLHVKIKSGKCRTCVHLTLSPSTAQTLSKCSYKKGSDWIKRWVGAQH